MDTLASMDSEHFTTSFLMNLKFIHRAPLRICWVTSIKVKYVQHRRNKKFLILLWFTQLLCWRLSIPVFSDEVSASCTQTERFCTLYQLQSRFLTISYINCNIQKKSSASVIDNIDSYRIMEVLRDFFRSSAPTPCSKQSQMWRLILLKDCPFVLNIHKDRDTRTSLGLLNIWPSSQ